MNVQCKRCGLAKTRLRHPSLPFDSLPYPTRTIRRRVRSVSHVTTKGKEVDHNLWVWGLCPTRASRSPAIISKPPAKNSNTCLSETAYQHKGTMKKYKKTNPAAIIHGRKQATFLRRVPALLLANHSALFSIIINVIILMLDQSLSSGESN